MAMPLKKLLKLLRITVLLVPVTALAWFPFGREEVDLWSFVLGSKTGNVCVRNVIVNWPDSMGVLSYFGKTPVNVCHKFQSAASTTMRIGPGLMKVTWTDASNIAHAAEFPLQALIGEHVLYGGELMLRFNGADLDVLLTEPDKSKYSMSHIWPEKNPIVIYSTTSAK